MSALSQVDPGRARTKRIRRIFGQCLRAALEQHGDNLAGFAIVAWDMRGSVHSSYATDVGPIGESLMPAVAHDALNRHVAVAISQRSSSILIDGA